MSLKFEQPEIETILNRLLDRLAATVSSQAGRLGADLRWQIGRVRDNYMTLMMAGTFATELLACFTKAKEANVKLAGLTRVHQQLFAEDPSGAIAKALVQTAISFCLSTEARLVTAMTFVSRDDVEAMMAKMKAVFDTAREKAADVIDSSTYQALTFLAAALTNHLASTSHPLPRMVKFKLARHFPALTASHRLYYVANRSDELVQENHTVHPLFMGRELKGLNR